MLALPWLFPMSTKLACPIWCLKILYHIINKRQDAVAKGFCPLARYGGKTQEISLPLFGLETGTHLADFDMIGFSLQYELTYTNILNMLALGNILYINQNGVLGTLCYAGALCL